MRIFEEIEKVSMEMIAVYYSHPYTIPFPSETDVKMVLYPEVSSIVIPLKGGNNPMVKAFSIREEAIYPEEIKVIP
jgi:proteasome lid subunit RPN8/RPN11